MDDNNFDKIIKEKADAFLDSGHDAHALTDLRSRLSNLPAKKTGWSSGRTAYIVGSLVLFTLINFSIVWYFSEGRHTVLTDEIDQLRSERSQFISLQNELVELRAIKVDTVYIYRDLLATHDTGTADLHYSNSAPVSNEGYISLQSNQAVGNYKLLADDQELSEELENFLVRNNLILRGDQGKRVLIVQNVPVTSINARDSQIYYGNMTPGIPDNIPDVATYEELEPQKPPTKKEIPNKMLWALEKHNHKGLDFQFGLEAMFHKTSYDIGAGDINGGLGLMTEVIFSPVLRLETGIHFGARSYSLKEDEISTLPPGTLDDYPGLDDDLGRLIRLESDAKLIKVPINLKVFGILDHNKKWYASVGLTPQWATTQELDYKYAIDTPDLPEGDLEYVSFIGSKQEMSPAFYVTTFNLGAGTEVYLNDKFRWQIGVFYQKGLSEAGVENRKLQSFGIKSSLWFNKP